MRFSPLDSSEDFMGRGGLRFSLSLFNRSTAITSRCPEKRRLGSKVRALYTLRLKNVPPATCHNLHIYDPIMIIFGRDVTDKVSNQRTCYYATSKAQITCASALHGRTGKHKNCIFQTNAVLVHCQNSTSRCLISSIFLTHDSYSRYCMTL